jgi:hypothetical protein
MCSNSCYSTNITGLNWVKGKWMFWTGSRGWLKGGGPPAWGLGGCAWTLTIKTSVMKYLGGLGRFFACCYELLGYKEGKRIFWIAKWQLAFQGLLQETYIADQSVATDGISIILKYVKILLNVSPPNYWYNIWLPMQIARTKFKCYIIIIRCI